MKATIEIIKITPAIAQQYLENQIKGQRPRRPAYEQKLAAEILSGNWRLSTDAVLLIKGRMANGQHRMAAVCIAGVAAEFLVMRSDDEELYKIIDAGIKRTVADTLVGIDHSTLVAAASGLLMRYEKSLLTPLGHRFLNKTGHGLLAEERARMIVTRSELIDYARSHTEQLARGSQLVSKLRQQSGLLAGSVAVALYVLGAKKDDERARLFITEVYTGEHKDNAANDFRERLIRQRLAKSKLPSQYLFGIGIKSMRSFFQGTRTGKLRIHDGEPFPRFEDSPEA